MEIRRPLEWHCKQMDHFVGLNFSANFNFALVGHLLKGKVFPSLGNLSQMPSWVISVTCSGKNTMIYILYKGM